MLSRSNPIIAREGWWLVITLGIGVSVALWLNHQALAAAVGPLFLLSSYLFRDPKRKTPPRPLGVVAPVDGRVIAIENEVDDPQLQRKAKRIRVRMNLSGCFSIFCPIEGKISHLGAAPGERVGVNSAFIISTDEQDDVGVTLIGGDRLTPRLYAQQGERVGHGQRCGFFLFGRDVDIFLPQACRIEVEVGTRVRAAQSIVATLVRSAPVTGLADVPV